MNEPNHSWADLGDVMLHYVEMGDPDAPLIVLLHGFPEYWYAWHNQIERLAAAGYHVLAPDMRGYNRSQKPRGIEPYRLSHLTSDVVGLIQQTGADRATVVGHDWGGVIAWELAHRHPTVLEQLVVLNAPHLDALAREFRSPAQLARSWYAGFLQLPRIPEFVLGRGEYGWLDALLRYDPTNPDAFGEEDIRRYKRALAKPGVLTAAINYYRALVRANVRQHLGLETPPERSETTDVPTLLIWGERDSALSTDLTDGLDRWVSNIRVERLPEASHWVQNDAPERVNELLCGFIEERT